MKKTRWVLRAAGATVLVGLGVSLAGCSWIDVTPEAERVRIVPQDRVSDCTLRGTVNAATKAEVIGLTRNIRVVTDEVDNLARLEAVDLNADTLVALGPVDRGARSYRAYRCLAR